ncbi:MAG: hypothetical protein UU76_C0001G0031 [Parcubacteria group bacterium GW2011_GWC1_41_7]|nr:MAG: hypothetical protein UU76_C0001G0031 [Parcubacteria group bacterium GW2011_GWC1_41_7]
MTFAFSQSMVFIAGIVMGILGLVLLYFFLSLIARHRERVKVNLALNYSLLLVEAPKYTSLPKTDGTTAKLGEEILYFENFLGTINKIKFPIVFEAATPHFGEEIFFYVGVPNKYIELIQKNIKSFLPGAEVSVVKEDYNIFNPEGVTVGSFVTLKSHYFKMLKSYQEVSAGNVDPLDAFLSSFNKLKKEGEGLSYQIMVRPLSSRENAKISGVLKKMKEGKGFDEARGSITKEVFSLPKSEKTKTEEATKPKIVDETLIKNLEGKMGKPFFEVNVRLVSSAKELIDAEELLSTAESAFGQFANPGYNEFSIIRVHKRGMRDFVYNFAFRLFSKKHRMVLNTEEIASIFHFPTSYTKSPLVHFLSARRAPSPVNLPQEGTVLGESVYQGMSETVRITQNDRRRHIYLIGQTGTGKTTLLKNIIEQDIKNGSGVCFIDPHGDDSYKTLGLIPKERVDDVMYFNPGDMQRPMGLNILEYDARYPEQKTFIINALIEIIDKLYNLSQTGGPMFEQYLRNALLLIMDDPSAGYTLLEVSKVFVDEQFRKKLVAACRNDSVVEFWAKQAPAVGGELSMENMITWITSKLNPFITNDFVRPIIAQSKSSLNFKDVMDNRKILIVNLSKGKIGETSAYLLGMILVAKILSTAFARVDVPEEQRTDFYLFIDEFQNFAFKGISSILSEARKYRLSLFLAHQYIKQLPEDISGAVFGNVGTIVSFRVGAEDGEFLEQQFHPVFTRTDMVNIPNYHAYVRLLIDGYVSDPFSIRTLIPTNPNMELAAKIVELSALKYGKPKEEIDEDIRNRFKPIAPSAPPVASMPPRPFIPSVPPTPPQAPPVQSASAQAPMDKPAQPAQPENNPSTPKDSADPYSFDNSIV